MLRKPEGWIWLQAVEKCCQICTGRREKCFQRCLSLCSFSVVFTWKGCPAIGGAFSFDRCWWHQWLWFLQRPYVLDFIILGFPRGNWDFKRPSGWLEPPGCKQKHGDQKASLCDGKTRWLRGEKRIGWNPTDVGSNFNPSKYLFPQLKCIWGSKVHSWYSCLWLTWNSTYKVLYKVSGTEKDTMNYIKMSVQIISQRLRYHW